MPAYTVTSIIGRFAPEQKVRLAAALTTTHCSATGAPAYLVQVIFKEVPASDYFVGGKPLKFDSVLIQGLIRDGHGDETKTQLITEMMHAVAAIGETDRSAVQVYLSELPARQIAEWGSILPDPGGEASWKAQLPQDVQKRIAWVMRPGEFPS